jgi:ssDNA-binding Zn-finger/Zn-ribbon topoisomerase 1
MSRRSIYGKFIGCLGYPKCRHTEKIGGNENKEEKKEEKTDSEKEKN